MLSALSQMPMISDLQLLGNQAHMVPPPTRMTHQQPQVRALALQNLSRTRNLTKIVPNPSSATTSSLCPSKSETSMCDASSTSACLRQILSVLN